MGPLTTELGYELQLKSKTDIWLPSFYESPTPGAAIKGFHLPRQRKLRVVTSLSPKSAHKAFQQILDSNPDVIHLFTGLGTPWSVWWANWAYQAGVPFIVTAHDPRPHPGRTISTFLDHLSGFVLRRATKVHLLSRCFVPEVIAQGVHPDKLVVIPHGDLSQYYRRVATNGPSISKEKQVLFFGRLERYKGIDTLLRAAKHLDSSWNIRIVGPGKLSPQESALATSLGSRCKVEIGYVPDSEVVNLFASSAVCALPYTQATQSSLPSLAASFGVPVIGTASGGFVDDIPAVNGILVEPNDPIELARGIELAYLQAPIVPGSLQLQKQADSYLGVYHNLHAPLEIAA